MLFTAILFSDEKDALDYKILFFNIQNKQFKIVIQPYITYSVITSLYILFIFISLLILYKLFEIKLK